MRKLPGLIVGAVLVSSGIAAVGHAVTAGPPSPPQLVAAYGSAVVDGERAVVHTVSVVRPGESPAAVAAASIAAQGARPISKAEYTLTGLEWGDSNGGTTAPDAVFNYIEGSSGDVLGADNQAAIQVQFEAALAAWAGKSNLDVHDLGVSTETCPSLVRECPGKQVSDGTNDVGWVDIKGASTLGVTWYTSSEADIALDFYQDWFIAEPDTASSSQIDILSIALHEFGHGLGLDHSTEDDSVMNAYYGDVAPVPGCDDIEGLIAIYGGALPAWCDDTTDPPAPVTEMTATWEYDRSGPRGRDLTITVTVRDNNDDPVAGATEWAKFEYGDGSEGPWYGSGATTSSTGEVRWRIRNAPGAEDPTGANWMVTVYVDSGDLECDDTCTTGPPTDWPTG